MISWARGYFLLIGGRCSKNLTRILYYMNSARRFNENYGHSFARYFISKIFYLETPLDIFTLISVLLEFTFIVLLINSLEPRGLTGLCQRLLIATTFLWCGVAGIKLFNLVRSDSTQQ